jgi:hypothetical protein
MSQQTMHDVLGYIMECGHEYREIRFYGKPVEGTQCKVCGQQYPFGTPLQGA